MNHTKVMIGIIEMAKMDQALQSEDAISYVASLIDRLDPASESYAQDMDNLLRLGACIWKLQQAM